jgi:hypothetical protein
MASTAVEPPATTAATTTMTTNNHNKEEDNPRMNKKTMTESVPAQPAGTALERVLAAYEQAKLKVREANDALGSVAVAVREALREDKQRRLEIESVRAGLARLQAIKV